MQGILLDPLTGRPDGAARVPMSGEVGEWAERLERTAALRRCRDLLGAAARHPEVRAATTTNRYLAYPAAANGISKSSSGGAAWSFSTYIELVPVSTITTDFYLAGLTWMWHTPAAAADTTYEVLFEVATGAAASEVLIAQFPGSFRADSLVGYVPSNVIILPEPKFVAANTRLSLRVAQGLATTSQTYQGIKIIYQMP